MTLALFGLSALTAHGGDVPNIPAFHVDSRTYRYDPGTVPALLDGANLYYAGGLSRTHLEYRF